MQHRTGSFSGMKQHKIFTQQWLPSGQPRAAVVVVHGLAEHSGRYAHVARFLTGRSYVRAGSMQRGNIVIYPIVDDVDGDGPARRRADSSVSRSRAMRSIAARKHRGMHSLRPLKGSNQQGPKH